MTRKFCSHAVLKVLGWSLFLTRPVVATPDPISIYFDDQFRGYDGFWSAAQIGVGTPPQFLSLLPNTISSEIWVADPWPCGGSVTCQQARGGLYYDNRSSTWDQLGFFELGYALSPQTLGGRYGLETVTLSDTTSASNQSVASFNTTELWLGSLGLNVKENEYVTGSRHLALISSLVHNESLIPSNSYGYTAGAYYAERSLAGSLTLGGTDITRYTPNNISFRLNSPNYEPVLAVKSITVSAQSVTIPTGWNTNPLSLMAESDASTFTVDSSTPFLWMPEDVCDAFAAAFNLTYNPDLDLYVFSNTSSSRNLTNLDLVFNFVLAETTTSASSISIPISYDAFDLQLSYPFPGFTGNASSPSLDYFPLRRANSSLQYIIGRAFLQETYLTVDYERGNFSISSAVFPDLNRVNPQIVPITRPADSSFLPPQGGTNNLPIRAKVGIGVGVAVAVLLASVLAFFYIRRKRSGNSDGSRSEKKSSFNLLRFVKQRKGSPNVATELPGDRRQPKEMQADVTNTRFELPGNEPVEMPAGDIPDSYLQNNKDLSEGSSSDDGARPSSMEKHVMATMQAVSERSHSPVPPYSPTDVGAQNNTTSTGNSATISSGISPTSPHFGSGFHGSHSSGEQGISPIIQSSNNSNSFPKSQSSASEEAVSQPQHQASSSLNSQARSSLHSARASVQQDQIPNRTISRSSRFREELTIEEDSQPTDGERPRVIRQRFSWEQ